VRGLHIVARTSAVAAALLIAAAAHAAPAPQAGGVAIDMTLDAARTATPTIAWQEEKSAHTGKTLAISADAAFVLDGQSYRVNLRPLSHGAATMRLTGEAQVKNRKACRKRVVALASHFNAYFEMIAPLPSMSNDGNDHEMLDAGRNARVDEIEVDATDAIQWGAGQRATKDDPYAFELTADYNDEGVEPNCRIEAIVELMPPGRPVMDTLDPAGQKLIAKPSAATMHYSLEGVDLPPQGLTLAYRCAVERPTGKLHHCVAGDRERAEAPVERAAFKRLAEMKLDPATLDPDSDLMLQTVITIKLSPSDRVKNPPKLTMSPAPPPLTPRPVPVWTRAPTSADLSRHYPTEALNKDLQARVFATCRIAEDLSLACARFEINPPENTMFEDAARRILALYRAGPKLKDGTDAVGAVVRVPIRFQLEDAPLPPAPSAQP